jgi:hypothetical protein
MKYNLKEELEQYLRLSNYNPKLTLTENVNLVSEAILNPATSVRELESTLGKTMQQLARELKIGSMDAATLTKLLEKDAASFEKEWAKTLQKDIKNGALKGELGPLGKELSKVELLRRLTSETKLKGGPLTVAEMDALKAEIKGANKLRASKFNPKGLEIKPTDPDPLDITRRRPDIKTWDWKKLSKWGLAAGIGVGTLYAIYKMTHEDEPPTITPTPPSPTPTPRTPFVWDENCTIYKIGCKSDVIAKVQGCVGGLTTDGMFGKKTSIKLKELGYNTFTDADVDKICKTQPVVDPDSEDIEEKDPNQQ